MTLNLCYIFSSTDIRLSYFIAFNLIRGQFGNSRSEHVKLYWNFPSLTPSSPPPWWADFTNPGVNDYSWAANRLSTYVTAANDNNMKAAKVAQHHVTNGQEKKLLKSVLHTTKTNGMFCIYLQPNMSACAQLLDLHFFHILIDAGDSRTHMSGVVFTQIQLKTRQKQLSATLDRNFRIKILWNSFIKDVKKMREQASRSYILRAFCASLVCASMENIFPSHLCWFHYCLIFFGNFFLPSRGAI